MKMRFVSAGILGVVSLLAGKARAVDPFDAWANPKGHYLVAYPLHYNAQEKTDKDGVSDNTGKGLTNADLHLTQSILRWVYYGDKPQTWLLNVYFPVGRMDIFDQHDAGIGDPTLVAGYFFLDDKKTNTYMSLGLKADMPWGEYDKTRAANMGSNRLRWRPLLSFAKLSGPVDLEALLIYDIRRANKDFPFGGSYDEGDQVQVETYAGMFLSRTFMPGLHLNWAKGSEDKYDAGAGLGFQEVKDSAVKNMQLGASALWLLGPKLSVMLQAMHDVSPKNAFKGTLFLSRIAWKV